MSENYPNAKELRKRAREQSKDQPRSKLFGGEISSTQPKSKLCCNSSSKKSSKKKSSKY